MRPVTLTLVSSVADPNGIAEAQTPGSAGDLTLDGALVTDGVASWPGSQVVITSDDDDSGVTFTVVGTARDGSPLSETITGPNTATVPTVGTFITVSEVSISGAATGSITVGTADVAYSNPCPMDFRLNPFNVGLTFSDSGSTTSFTVQYSGDNPWDYASADAYNAQGTWFDHPYMAAMQANVIGNVAFAVFGIRLKSNQAGTDTGVLKITQSGE